MKRVFVFGIRGFPWIGGGAERHSEELYPRLVKKGYDITVLCRKYSFPVWKGIKFKKLPYINNRYLETMSHSIICSLYCLIKRPDIIHIHNMGACLLVPLLSFSGLKVVFSVHSLNYEHPKWGHFAKFVLNTLENLGISFSQRKIILSQNMLETIRSKFHRTVGLHFIPNGVNEAEFIPAGITLTKYHLKEKKYILAVGRLVPEKGFDKLVEAYKKIPTPDYKLVIIGNGEAFSKYKFELLTQKNDSIIFTGFLCGKELAELYTNAGLFVSTSTNEGFPLVVLEALSYGLPILLSPIPAHKEMKLSASKYYNTFEELPLRIEQTFKEGLTPQEKREYKKLLQEKYNWDAITEKTKDMYEN